MGKIEIEKGLIGSLLVSSKSESLYAKDLWLSPSDFVDLVNRDVFTAILSVEARGEPVDLMTVKNECGELGMKVSNAELLSYTDGVFTSSNINAYSSLIKKETRRMSLLSVAEELKMRAGGWDIGADSLFDAANKIISMIGGDSMKYGVDGEAYEDWCEYLAERVGKKLFGFSWGENLGFLDEYTKGIQKGRTYRIGAPSNTGKSQLSYGVINALLLQGAKVAFFTLENDKPFTLTNLYANYSKTSSYAIERGDVKIDTSYIEKVKGNLFIIDDTYDLSEVFAKTLEIKPDVVILDYIGLITIRRTDEEAKYTEYSKRVQEFVKKSKVGWIDLSNLPKSQEDVESIKSFGGFYGSSFLKNNADVGIHLAFHTPFYEFKKIAMEGGGTSIKNKSALELIITKNRIGTAKVSTVFKVDFDAGGTFSEATAEDLITWKTSF